MPLVTWPRTTTVLHTEKSSSALVDLTACSGLSIKIRRIIISSVVDSDSLNPDPDPAFHANPDTDPDHDPDLGFW
jgi:hypothetical protein